MKFLLCLTLLLSVARAAAAGPAGGTAPKGPAEELPPELIALLAAQSKWSTALGAEIGIGYKDNLLLSHASPERSAFTRYEVEAFVWHLPRGRTDYSAIVNAEQTRYFSGKTIDDESLAFAQFQWRYGIDERFRFAFDFQGYYLDEVRDVSDTDVQRVVARQKLTGGSTGPTLRWSPRPWGWMEVQGTGKRDSFEDGFYNAKIGEEVARLGWKPHVRVELSFAAIHRLRRFDRRQQYKLSGLPLDGTLLVVVEREREARLDLTLDAAARWRTSTRIGAVDYGDNGSGYFNYRQKKATQSLEWKHDRWHVSLDAAARRRDYEKQSVGVGLTPSSRVIDDYSARLRVERKLSAKWTALVNYAWERSRSNDAVASYRVNEGLLGARWSWEK